MKVHIVEQNNIERKKNIDENYLQLNSFTSYNWFFD